MLERIYKTHDEKKTIQRDLGDFFKDVRNKTGTITVHKLSIKIQWNLEKTRGKRRDVEKAEINPK